MSVQLLIEGDVVHPAVEAILFDKDGTLVDIHHYWSSMIRIRADLIVKRWFARHHDRDVIECALIDAMGVSQQSGRMKPEGPVGVKPRSFIVDVAAETACIYGACVSNMEMERLFAEVDQATENELLPLLRVLPGVESLLGQLGEAGVASVIVSTDITPRARKAMEVLSLDGCFKEIIGGDQVVNSKPATDLTELALQRLGCRPEHAVVIGDHPVDVMMGSAVGVGLNIGVLTGLSSENSFAGLDCRIVHDLTAINIRKTRPA